LHEDFDDYSLYCLDEAINFFGSEVDQILEDITGKNAKAVAARRNNKLRQLCGLPREYRGIEGLMSEPPSKSAGVEAPFRKE
jgi:hypothetical protein